MTALACAIHGCAASHNWRKLTIGTSGSPNQIGFSDPLSLNYGAFNNRQFRGANNIIVLDTDSINTFSGAKLSVVLGGTWNASDFNAIECQRTDGSVYRYLFTDPGLLVAHLVASGPFPARTEFDWNPPSNLPHGVALWSPGDVGKTVFVNLD